jgi:hypothetical protein
MPGLLYVKAANLPWASKEAFLPLCLVTGGTYVCPVLLLRCDSLTIRKSKPTQGVRNHLDGGHHLRHV